ncbi:MAG: exosortase C-terminal domain/associated protein EpsI [Pseudomonadota bacterium]
MNRSLRFGTGWQAALLVLGYLLCFGGALLNIVAQWNTEDYSYAYLLPPVVAYIIWDRRRDLARADLRPYWPGLGLFLFACLATFFGILGAASPVLNAAVWLMPAAVLLFCYGVRFTRMLLLPLILTCLAVPLPTIVQDWLTRILKMLSSHIAVWLMRLAGLSVCLEGNVVDLGFMQLQVVDACSGLRFFFPLLALTLIFTHFFQPVRWKRVVLVLSSVPISILLNGFRVGITGILSELWDPNLAEGFFHGFSGWLLFVVSLPMLFLLNRLLELFGPPAAGGTAEKGPVAQVERPGLRRSSNGVAWGVAALALILLGVLSLTRAQMPALVLPQGIEAFPLQFGGWRGVRAEVPKEIVALSGADESFDAAYWAKGSEVSLYLGYQRAPYAKNDKFLHSPTICLPSAGWSIISLGTRKMSGVHGAPSPFVVREMVVEKMGERMLVYYWFQTRRRVAPTSWLNRVHLALTALERENTYDVFVRLTSPIAGDRAVAGSRLDRFVRDMEPILGGILGQARSQKN